MKIIMLKNVIKNKTMYVINEEIYDILMSFCLLKNLYTIIFVNIIIAIYVYINMIPG